VSSLDPLLPSLSRNVGAVGIDDGVVVPVIAVVVVVVEVLTVQVVGVVVVVVVNVVVECSYKK
jgi:hypothetical protein